MEMIYAALLLNSAKQPISEDNVTKVITATGTEANPAKVKALVAALDGVNIEEAISKAAVPVAAAAPAATEKKKEGKPKETEEDKEKKAEDAAAGLGALFG